MSRLTADERRRTFELRQAAVSPSRQPRAVTFQQFSCSQRAWSRAARLGALVSLALAGTLLVAQAARVVSVHGAPPSLIEWLLPRL
ncbi:MAG: hypothetical protein AABZ83_07065 [candidate division NC10 bacterium]|mgnify:FL=1